MPQLSRWKGIAFADMSLEIVSFLIPLVLLKELNMACKLKFQVVMAFVFRLPMAALAFFHLRSVVHLTVESDQPRLAATESVALLQVTLTWSVMSATIPNLRGFVSSFTTRFGMMPQPAVLAFQASQNSFPLMTIGGTHMPGTGQARHRASRAIRLESDVLDSDDDEPTFRPDIARNTTTIHANAGSETTAEHEHYANENESQERIIRKQVQWEVHHESQDQHK